MKLAHKWMMGHTGGSGGGSLIGTDPDTWSHVRTYTAPEEWFGFTMSPDGTKFVAIRDPFYREVRQYDMSTAYNMTTGTLTSTVSHGAQDIRGLSYGSDGSILYALKKQTTSNTRHFSIECADYVVDTTPTLSESGNLSSENWSYRHDVGDNGTTIITRRTTGGSGTAILRYTMSIANDVTSGGNSDQTFNLAARGDGTVTALKLAPGGAGIWHIDGATKLIYTPLSTAFDLTTVGTSDVAASAFSEPSTVEGMEMLWQGGFLYIFEKSNPSKVYQYEYTGTDV